MKVLQKCDFFTGHTLVALVLEVIIIVCGIFVPSSLTHVGLNVVGWWVQCVLKKAGAFSIDALR